MRRERTARYRGLEVRRARAEVSCASVSSCARVDVVCMHASIGSASRSVTCVVVEPGLACPCHQLSLVSRFTSEGTTDRGFGPFRAGGSLGSTLQVVCRRVSFRWAAPLRVVSNHARAKRAGTLAYSGVHPSQYLRPCTRGLPVSHLFVYVLRMHIHMSSLNLCQ